MNLDDVRQENLRLRNENERYKEMANAATGEVEYDENGNIINKINDVG